MQRRVMFYVQHLLGVGHLKRASLIARALVLEGLAVTVVTGGSEVWGIRFDGCARVVLPPVHAADETFKILLDDQGRPIDDAWKDRRIDRLLTEFTTLRPQLLLIEMFPFGRLQFQFELLPLLETALTAEARPLIVASVRDALVRREDPERNRRRVRLAEKWFDRILVHGDQRLFPLEATFPEAAAIAEKLVYTGYVVEETDGNGDPATGAIPRPAPGAEISDQPRSVGAHEVIVSVGGGAVGLPLLEAALAARPLTRFRNHVWRLITGPNLPNRRFEALAWDPPQGVIIERWRDDLPRLLSRAALSISQGGYNTVMDLLRAKVPAVIVPFAAGHETEQAFRARILAERGMVTLLEADRLSPKNLAEAIDRAATTAASFLTVDMTGAKTTARLIAGIIEPKSVA